MSLRRVLFTAAGLLVTVTVAAPQVLPAVGRFLVEDDPAAHADAIVVLAGSYPDRILEGVQLYRDGLAPRILICPEPDTAGFRRATELGVRIPRPYDINRMVAEQLGVPPTAIEILHHGGDSTFGEAEAVLAEALRRGYTSIILVTSKYHTRRAAAIYRFLAAGKIQITVRSARDDDFQPESWWRDRLSARRLVIEYEKWLSFVLIDRWRFSPIAKPSMTPAGTG
jgi:uncharacterized SAM-binding protein YcdF (DUF218 family)